MLMKLFLFTFLPSVLAGYILRDRWGVGFAALFVAGHFGMHRVTEFFYFQF